jgi:hypothetical protein
MLRDASIVAITCYEISLLEEARLSHLSGRDTRRVLRVFLPAVAFNPARRQDCDLMRRGHRVCGMGQPLLGIGWSERHELVRRNRKARDFVSRHFGGCAPDPAEHQDCGDRDGPSIRHAILQF